MNQWVMDGYIEEKPRLETYGQGKERVDLVFRHKLYPGSKWEKDVPVKCSARGDRVRNAILALDVGDFVTLSGSVGFWQSKNNPAFWNPQFEVTDIIGHISGNGGGVEVPDPMDDTPF